MLTGKLSIATIAVLMASAVSLFISPATVLADQENAQSKDLTLEPTPDLAPDLAPDSAQDSLPVAIPGTSVSLVPPSGFILSQQFSGFEHPETFSSIVLTELPLEAHTDIAETFSSTPEEISAAFASQGIMLDVEDVSNLLVGGAQVPFVEGIQTVGSTQIKKYFALIAGENTILLTFNVIDTTQLKKEAVVETLQSVELLPVPTIQQKVDELPFTFSTADPFQVLEVLAGSSVILSVNGESDPAGETPLVIIANSVSPVQVADLADFSAQLLKSTEGFENSTIVEQMPATFAGEAGYFLQALSGDETVLQYLSILPDGFYIRMVVVGSAENLDALMPAIQTIQNSVAARE